MNRRYFVTGGTGFIGRALVKRLLARTDTQCIYLLTRRPAASLPSADPRIRVWSGDITTVKFPDTPITHLIHAAAEANDLLQPDQPRYYYTVVEGTRRVFDWARQQEIPNTLFVSSGIVEKDCDTVYCRAKRMGEFIGKLILPSFKIARVYSVVGEEMPLNGQYALGKFIYEAQYTGRVTYYPSKATRSYMHVDDVAEWLEAVMDKGIINKPYDVGGAWPIDVTDLAHYVANLWGVPCESRMAQPRDSYYVPSLMPSLIDLGVTQKILLHEALLRVKRYLEEKDGKH